MLSTLYLYHNSVDVTPFGDVEIQKKTIFSGEPLCKDNF